MCAPKMQLCAGCLLPEYPPSTTTLAYFVLPEEWKSYQQNPRGATGLARYLIAQRAGALPPDGLAGLKRYLHSTQGDMPDHTRSPSVFAASGRVGLGITDESADSISFGAVMKLEDKATPSRGPVTVASINSAIAVRHQMLSLYVFDSVKNPTLVRPVKTLSRKWLACLRQKN